MAGLLGMTLLASATSASADVPPPRLELQVRVRDAGPCDSKAVSLALRALKGRIERCADGETGTLSAVLTLAPGQTTAVAKVRSTLEPAAQRCIVRRALQTAHLPGQPACTPHVQLTLERR
jgi:hypothetical protein